MSDDDRRIYDMVARRFLAVFHPEAVFENTRVETTVAEHIFRTRGKVLVVPGWRGVYGELADDERRARRGGRGPRPAAAQAREGRERRHARGRGPGEKETKPPRRYSDASLLGAMETAGKLVDDDELREAMKESGIGTPATRAAIIERLIDVGYVERDGRALVPTEKGMNVIRLLGDHPLTSPDADRRVGAPPGRDRGRRGDAQDVHGRHREVRGRRPSASSTPSSRTSASRARTSGRARSAATTSWRTARATRAGRARTRAAAS